MAGRRGGESRESEFLLLKVLVIIGTAFRRFRFGFAPLDLFVREVEHYLAKHPDENINN